METKEWTLAKWGGQWCVSAVTIAMWKASHFPDFHTHLSQHKMENSLISSLTQILGLQPGELYTEPSGFRASERWQHWNIKQVAQVGSINARTGEASFFGTYWTNTKLKVKVSWVTSLLVWDLVSLWWALVKMAVHRVIMYEFLIEEEIQAAVFSR